MSERFDLASLRTPLLASLAVLGAACSSGDSSTPYEPINVISNVSLAAGGYIVRDSIGGGAVAFPAADAGGAQHLVVAQLTTMPEGTTSGFSVSGQASLVGMPLTRLAVRRPTTVAEQFHGMLRAREAQMVRDGRLMRGSLIQAAPRTLPPPTVGSQRSFKVCSSIQCTGTVTVTATAQFVGAHAAIYLDNANPANGLTANDLAILGQEFDAVLYPIDTDRFGAESDIDGNGVVVVLLTKAVNALVTKPACNDSYIAGYFFGGDLAPGFAQQFNNGEVFYGLAPDPAGSATTCAYSTRFVKTLLPVTFIHEFQHMISFNQHVLIRGGNEEVLWLNEAMSHLAEELGGLHYDSLNTPSGDTTASSYLFGNVYNAYQYLLDPGTNAVVTEEPPGTLEERGGEWLMLRYIVDRFGPTTTRNLEQTALTGEDNVHAVTNQPFDVTQGEWMLAVYLTDLPNFTPPANLQFSRWHFRTTFASLHSQDPQNFPKVYPLVPDSATGSDALASGSVSAGSGSYLLVTQPADAPAFSLAFRNSAGQAQPQSAGPQLAVARIH